VTSVTARDKRDICHGMSRIVPLLDGGDDWRDKRDKCPKGHCHVTLSPPSGSRGYISRKLRGQAKTPVGYRYKRPVGASSLRARPNPHSKADEAVGIIAWPAAGAA
jgi:hypothetical protein